MIEKNGGDNTLFTSLSTYEYHGSLNHSSNDYMSGNAKLTRKYVRLKVYGCTDHYSTMKAAYTKNKAYPCNLGYCLYNFA